MAVSLAVCFCFVCAPSGGDDSFENTRGSCYRSGVYSFSLVPSRCVLQSPITYILYVMVRYSHNKENVGLQGNPGSLSIENISPSRGCSGPVQIRIINRIYRQRRGSHNRCGVP